MSKSDWINVEVQSPENSGEYLVVICFSQIDIGTFNVASKKWQRKHGQNPGMDPGITHWMILPKLPPKEE